MNRMDCTEVRDLLLPYTDDELPPEEQRAVAAHLGDCPTCADALAELEFLRQKVRKAGTHALPAGLEGRVRTVIFATQGGGAGNPWRKVAALGASHLAAGVLGALLALAVMLHVGGRDRMVDDVVSAHVRGLLAGQPTQVASADPHVIRPWFGGKVTYAPLVKDLSGEGFPLLGARVDYVSQRAVAAIVYGRRLHRITLFVLPGEHGAPVDLGQASLHGYNVYAWRDGGFSYYAASDLNRRELEDFAKLILAGSAR